MYYAAWLVHHALRDYIVFIAYRTRQGGGGVGGGSGFFIKCCHTQIDQIAAKLCIDHGDMHITVYTVVQNCCNGRSKKYRKWHFWGCSLSETLQRIDIAFGRDDYVGERSNTLNGISIGSGAWSPRRVEMLMVCAFFYFLFLFYFLFVFSAARGQTVGPILTSDTSKCVFQGELHYFRG